MNYPENYRITDKPFNSEPGGAGAFRIDLHTGIRVLVIASDGEGWEHVSVSIQHRCATWEEMCVIKGIFWNDDECVVQFHPPKADHINNHKYCLHLWKPIGQEMPRPPKILVGI